MTTNNLHHAGNRMLLLGRKTSLERGRPFLLDMDDRLTEAGVVALPMSRRYRRLSGVDGRNGVSRPLMHEWDCSVLGQTQRQIVLLDRPELAK